MYETPTVRRYRDDRGFTLIELLVVVVIIGILVAIAIPLYSNYTKGAADKAAQSDVRNAVVVVEQCYADNANAYPGAGADLVRSNASAGADLDLSADGCANGKSHASDGTILTYNYTDGTTSYLIIGTNTGGAHGYTYDSTTGKTVQCLQSVTGTATPLTHC